MEASGPARMNEFVLQQQRLDYLLGVAKSFQPTKPEISRFYMMQLLREASGSQTSIQARARRVAQPVGLPNSFFHGVCTACGTLFVPGETYKAWCWRRRSLSQALAAVRKDGRKGPLASKAFVRSSSFIKMGYAVAQHRFVLVYRCLHCSTHTVYDSYPVKDSRLGTVEAAAAAVRDAATAGARKDTGKAEAKPMKQVVTEKVGAKRALDKFLQRKKKAGGPDDLGAFLLTLKKT